MTAGKIEKWVQRPGRKLRVVFVNDAFHAYVDLPDAAGAQKAYEDQLRAATGDTVSLYRPGSPYRDDITPPLGCTNLEVFKPGIPDAGERTVARPPRPVLASHQRSAVGGGAGAICATATIPTAQNSADVTRPVPPNAGSLTFPHWWSALAAVPAGVTELDWWAAGPDGRVSRYDRLKRVWFDATRNHWFYRSDQEDHLTATLWENFCLFHPRESVPALFAAAGLDSVRDVRDACWSYEFEEPVGGHLKQIDVTLHFRDAEGDGLLVVEAKRPRGSLKASDRDPGYYLDLPSFSFTPRRRTVYLVDERDLPAVRSAVRPADHRPGFLTWQGLGTLQAALAERLPVPAPVASFVSCLIRWQFDRHGFRPPSGPGCPAAGASWAELVAANQSRLGLPLAAVNGTGPSDLIAAQIAHAKVMDVPLYVRNFIAGAIQNQAVWCGIIPTRLAHDYLDREPFRAQIVAGMDGRQRTADRRKALWRIPTTLAAT